MKEIFSPTGWIWNAFAMLGITGIFGMVGTWAIRKIFYRREDRATLTKNEAEAFQKQLENKIAETNLNEIIRTQVAVEVKQFKDMLWEQAQEHFKVKSELQQRLEKEMKRRMEVEQDNDILMNELQTMREHIEELSKKVETLEKQK